MFPGLRPRGRQLWIHSPGFRGKGSGRRLVLLLHKTTLGLDTAEFRLYGACSIFLFLGVKGFQMDPKVCEEHENAFWF